MKWRGRLLSTVHMAEYRRAPEAVLRDRMMRRRMEAAQHVLYELDHDHRLDSCNYAMGENTRELLREERVQSEFEQRRKQQQQGPRRPQTAPMLTSSEQLTPPGSPSENENHLDISWPPANSPPNALGTMFKPTRPLTVSSSNSSFYLTSANMISYPGRKASRTSSLASLPSVRTIELPHSSTDARLSSGSFGGPSTFRAEEPQRVSVAARFLLQHNPSVVQVLEAKWPATHWGVYNTAPYRPSLRAAIADMHKSDLRWKNGQWVPREKVATPRSEGNARYR